MIRKQTIRPIRVPANVPETDPAPRKKQPAKAARKPKEILVPIEGGPEALVEGLKQAVAALAEAQPADPLAGEPVVEHAGEPEFVPPAFLRGDEPVVAVEEEEPIESPPVAPEPTPEPLNSLEQAFLTLVDKREPSDPLAGEPAPVIEAEPLPVEPAPDTTVELLLTTLEPQNARLARAGRTLAAALERALAAYHAACQAAMQEPQVVKPAKPAKPSGARAVTGERAQILASVQNGNLPPIPDFSAEVHRYNRGRLADLVEMAEKGDVAGLRAYPINPHSTSPKALDRYRNLCIQAIEARLGGLSK